MDVFFEVVHLEHYSQIFLMSYEKEYHVKIVIP